MSDSRIDPGITWHARTLHRPLENLLKDRQTKKHNLHANNDVLPVIVCYEEDHVDNCPASAAPSHNLHREQLILLAIRI